MNFFGTDGIRAKVGSYPLTSEMLKKIAYAIGKWSCNQTAIPNVIIAQDTRISCSWVKSNIKTGLLQFNINIYDCEVLPTPALFHLMNKFKYYHYGIIISGSHNLYYDNGVKIIDKNLKKLNNEDEKLITKLTDAAIEPDYLHFGTDNYLTDAQKEYISIINSFFQQNFLINTKIVLDVANGATYHVAEKIFNDLGANTIVINNKPNGININQNCGALHPEELREKVLQENALIGFAFDGDGDRVIAVNKHGIIKDGDDILALLSTHPDYIHSDTIIGTIMSNQGLENFLQRQNKKLIRTKVGDKYICQALDDNDLLLGGEQSGHIVIRPIINTGDGILIALKILQTMILTNNMDFETFTKFPQVLLNLRTNKQVDLNQEPYKTLINETQNKTEKGRILVRYSGTEPLIRIMVEDKNGEKAKELAHYLFTKLNNLLN